MSSKKNVVPEARSALDQFKMKALLKWVLT